MINGNKNNPFVAHYDWIVLGIGVVALIAGGVYYALAMGIDRDEEAATAASQIERLKPRECGVKSVDMTEYVTAVRVTRSPVIVAEVDEKKESFLASERRVKCKCGKAISGDVKAVPKCPFCGAEQEKPVEVVLDADNDGLPDEWEKRFGLNPKDAQDAAQDSDKDGFTNIEEFLAKTDPIDGKDHPDYLNSLSLTLPLKETYMPFIFRKASQIPGGYRCEFIDPSRKNDYGRKGRPVTAKVGESIIGVDGKNKVDYGFVVKSYTPKTERRKINGVMRPVDVSEALVERVSDKKQIVLVIQEKGIKPVAVDRQATLVYNRNGVKNFEVVPGDTIDLNGTKFRVLEILAEGKGAKVVLENTLSAKKHILTAP